MQGERKGLGGARLERYVRPGCRDPFAVAHAIGSELLVDQAGEVGALPAALGQQRVRPRQRSDPPIDRGDVGLDGVRAGQAHDRLHQRQCVARPVVDLARQQRLAFLGFLAVGDVDGHAADAHDVVGRVDARDRGSDAPAQLAIRATDAKLGLERRGVARRRLDRVLQMLPVLGMDQRPDIVDGDLEARRDRRRKSDTARRPRRSRRAPGPIPRTPSDRRPSARLRRSSLCISRAVEASSCGRSLRDATLQLLVELLELAGLAIELGEDPHLRTQHLGDDRDRNIIDRAHLIGAQAVDIGQVDGGDEDDRRLLEPRVLADHRRQLEAVELRHAHVNQDDGDILLEQLLERLPGRSGLDEILAQTRRGWSRSSRAWPADRRPAGC